jgi:DNA replication protein DnaC
LPLMNSQYEAILRTYASRQAKSRRELEERLARIQKKIPSLASLEASLSSLQAEKVRSAVEGDQKQKKRLEGEIARLQKERGELLEAAGYTLKDLKPSYLCPKCQDTGFVGQEKCRCFLQAEIDLLYHQSHLKEILKRENFRTFSYAWYEGEDREIMKRHVMDAELFIEAFDREFQNLLLLGEVGTGKTFLSNCIAKELMDTGHSVVYLTAFQLFGLLSKAVFGEQREGITGQQAYPCLLDCDLLIIDDLGTELPNSFTISQLFLCVNERILRRKSTLISSNLDMEALKNTYSERTLSRIISNYTIRQLPGSDIRIRKKLQSGT